MDINEIKDIVEENYGINIKSISKVKNSYNVKADEGEYCIKNIKYDFPHFNFIISAIEHLQGNLKLFLKYYLIKMVISI